jgi:mono/diheme cytochrome c family protein
VKRLTKVLGFGAGAIGVAAALGLTVLFTKYPDGGPVPHLSNVSSPERVARGEYLANHVAVCIDCHSERDWTKFSGPLKPGTEGRGGDVFDEKFGFPGSIVAANITPAGVGKMSDGELAHAIVSGIGKDGRALFPIMPYPAFASLAQDDLESIVAYIRSLPPRPHDVPERTLNFPVNLLVRTMPAPYTPHAAPNKGNGFEYGQYLTTMASCIHCHTPQEKGELMKGEEFSGGWEIPAPTGTIRSANITPDEETGIGFWTKEIFIAKFKEFEHADSSKLDLAVMGRQSIMPWTMYAGMTEEDLGAIYDYLRTVPPIKNRVEVWTAR